MNCSFNIRYKPRTTRAFTKSDLTVYDSAGNTALNALTVYGKSEVVNNDIKSAGEGWATVDLGTLTWYMGTSSFYATVPDIYTPQSSEENNKGMVCARYELSPNTSIVTSPDKSYLRANGMIYIKDTDYTDATTFKNSLNGVLLCYELADPTQGNTIAVKTDDGTGINGTMAVFSTGTPLRGIPDTDVRDVMQWNGSAGTVTKVCAKVRLADLTWNYSNVTAVRSAFTSATIVDAKIVNSKNDIPTFLCTNKTANSYNGTWTAETITQDTTGIITCTADPTITTVSDFVASLGDAELVYELATPTTEALTSTENDSIAALRTFAPQTHAQNNAQTDMTVDYTIRVPTI